MAKGTGIESLLGQSDFDVFTDTDNHVPSGFSHWIAVRPLEGDITPTTIATKAGSNLSGITLTKDVDYLGRFNSIKLAAGKIMAYRSDY